MTRYNNPPPTPVLISPYHIKAHANPTMPPFPNDDVAMLPPLILPTCTLLQILSLQQLMLTAKSETLATNDDEVAAMLPPSIPSCYGNATETAGLMILLQDWHCSDVLTILVKSEFTGGTEWCLQTRVFTQIQLSFSSHLMMLWLMQFLKISFLMEKSLWLQEKLIQPMLSF